MASRVLELLDKKIEEVRDHLAALEAIRGMFAANNKLPYDLTLILTAPEVNGKIVRTATPEDIASALLREIGPTPTTHTARESAQPMASPVPKKEAAEAEAEAAPDTPTATDSASLAGINSFPTHTERSSRLPKVLAYFDSLGHNNFLKSRDIADACGLDRSNIYPLLDGHPELFERQYGPRGSKWYRRKRTA